MSEINIIGSDVGRSFTANVGDSVNVELEENLSTGYSWESATSSSLILSLTETKHDQPPQSAAGAPGMRSFRFVATSRGAATIDLKLRRPWDPPGVAAQTFSVHVEVR
jgi:inhibitor of cysteine peptidase